MIMDKLNISYLRINLIKFDFFDAYTIMAKVEIVESFVTYSSKFLEIQSFIYPTDDIIFTKKQKYKELRTDSE